MTRVVPVPATISTQAQLVLGHAAPDQAPVPPLEERRSGTDQFTAVLRKAWTRLCPNQLVEDKIAGVPVRIVTPDGLPEANNDKVLLNLHGGGFNSDSGSYTESIPIASYTKIKVVAVLYRLAPEYPFPAAVDDSVAVYKELLKTYKPEHIVIYGTSAGADPDRRGGREAQAAWSALAGGARHLQRHGRLRAQWRLASRCTRCAASPAISTRLTPEPHDSDYVGHNRPQRPDALANLQ